MVAIISSGKTTLSSSEQADGVDTTTLLIHHVDAVEKALGKSDEVSENTLSGSGIVDNKLSMFRC